MKVKKLPGKLYKKIYSLVPRVTIDAIIKSNEGVLFIKRGIPPGKGRWHLCGETVEYGETLEQAVHRGVKEETGMKVKILKYIGYYDDPKRDPRGPTISHVFLCKPIGGKLMGSPEGWELKFFKKIPKGLLFDHRKMLRDAGVK